MATFYVFLSFIPGSETPSRGQPGLPDGLSLLYVFEPVSQRLEQSSEQAKDSLQSQSALVCHLGAVPGGVPSLCCDVASSTLPALS